MPIQCVYMEDDGIGIGWGNVWIWRIGVGLVLMVR